MTLVGDNKRRAVKARDPSGYGIIFLFALSVSMVVFSLYGAQASVFQKARATVLDFFEPVLSIFAGPSRWVNGQVANVQDFFQMHDELERLRLENDALRLYQDETLVLRKQLAHYTIIESAKLPPAPTYIDAKVIGESAGPFNRALILSAGRDDQVTRGSAVVDGRGLLGHVVFVSNKAARVLPLTDVNSRIPVVLDKTDRGFGEQGVEIEALLAGRIAGEPVLSTFAQKLDTPLTVGQLVVTSGAGGVLPRGIPVGEVSGLDGNQITVRLYANYRTPDSVRVVDYRFTSDIEELSGGRGG